MKHLILFLAIAAVCAGGAGAAERPQDFAYGSALEIDGSEALYEVTLPTAVYQGVALPDLRDVRVFNGAGEVVPHAWRKRETASVDAPAPVALTLFSLKAQVGTRVDSLAIRVRRSAGGAVSVDVASPAGSAAAKHTVAYILDVSALERALRAIEFDWQMPPDGFAGKMRIDTSDDLAVWHTLVVDAPLVSLEVAGQRLQQKRIALPPYQARYLRLSWVGQASGQRPPDLVSARGEPAGKTVETPRAWAQFDAAAGAKPGEYMFDLGGHYPVDRVRLDLPEPNTIVQVELLARDQADRPWRPIARGVAYRLRQAGTEISSPEFAVGPATDRYWLLRVDVRGGGVGAGAPRLGAGWVPHQLVFAARGAAPFRLVYGNRDATSAAYSIETLIPGYRDDNGARIRTARTGAQQTVNVRGAQALAQQELGGEARRRDMIDWKRWSLWGALVLGVVMLGAMAWRLARQLKTDPRNSSSRDGGAP